jgi:hypothetical protein
METWHYARAGLALSQRHPGHADERYAAQALVVGAPRPCHRCRRCSDPDAFAVAGAEKQEDGEPPSLAGAGVVVSLMG